MRLRTIVELENRSMDFITTQGSKSVSMRELEKWIRDGDEILACSFWGEDMTHQVLAHLAVRSVGRTRAIEGVTLEDFLTEVLDHQTLYDIIRHGGASEWVQKRRQHGT